MKLLNAPRIEVVTYR